MGLRELQVGKTGMKRQWCGSRRDCYDFRDEPASDECLRLVVAIRVRLGIRGCRRLV